MLTKLVVVHLSNVFYYRKLKWVIHVNKTNRNTELTSDLRIRMRPMLRRMLVNVTQDSSLANFPTFLRNIKNSVKTFCLSSKPFCSKNTVFWIVFKCRKVWNILCWWTTHVCQLFPSILLSFCYANMIFCGYNLANFRLRLLLRTQTFLLHQGRWQCASNHFCQQLTLYEVV